MAYLYELNCKCGERYVGHTTNVGRRLITHKSKYRSNCNYKLYSHLRTCNMKCDDIKLNIIDKYDDLLTAAMAEGKYINKHKPSLNSVKYNCYNDKQTAWRQWYERNKAHRKAYIRKKDKCPKCKKILNKRSISRHLNICNA